MGPVTQIGTCGTCQHGALMTPVEVTPQAWSLQDSTKGMVLTIPGELDPDPVQAVQCDHCGVAFSLDGEIVHQSHARHWTLAVGTLYAADTVAEKQPIREALALMSMLEQCQDVRLQLRDADAYVRYLENEVQRLRGETVQLRKHLETAAPGLSLILGKEKKQVAKSSLVDALLNKVTPELSDLGATTGYHYNPKPKADPVLINYKVGFGAEDTVNLYFSDGSTLAVSMYTLNLMGLTPEKLQGATKTQIKKMLAQGPAKATYPTTADVLAPLKDGHTITMVEAQPNGNLKVVFSNGVKQIISIKQLQNLSLDKHAALTEFAMNKPKTLGPSPITIIDVTQSLSEYAVTVYYSDGTQEVVDAGVFQELGLPNHKQQLVGMSQKHFLQMLTSKAKVLPAKTVKLSDLIKSPKAP